MYSASLHTLGAVSVKENLALLPFLVLEGQAARRLALIQLPGV